MVVGDLFVRKGQRRAGKKRRKSFKRGGKSNDSCSPKISVDIRVVRGAGYLVVLSICL